MSGKDPLEELQLAVFGNEKTEAKGLMDRVKDLESTAKEIKEFKVLVRGIAIGLGLNLIALVAGIGAILQAVSTP